MRSLENCISDLLDPVQRLAEELLSLLETIKQYEI